MRWEARRPTAGRRCINRKNPAEGGEATVDELGALTGGRQLQRLVRGQLGCRGDVVELDKVEILGSDAGNAVRETGGPEGCGVRVVARDEEATAHLRSVSSAPPTSAV